MFLEFGNQVRAYRARAEGHVADGAISIPDEVAQTQAYEIEQKVALDALLAKIYAKRQAGLN